MQQEPAPSDAFAAAEAPPTDPEATPPPWLHKHHDSVTVSVEQLLANKIEQEEVLSQTGITDPSEGDFTNCIQPILNTCSKESIAVRNLYRPFSTITYVVSRWSFWCLLHSMG